MVYVSGAHGDFTPFDGTGGALAHTILPYNTQAAGDVHFDDGETWSLSSRPGTTKFKKKPYVNCTKLTV